MSAKAMIGHEVETSRDGSNVRRGIIERYEKRPGNWRNINTGKLIAKKSVRFLIKPKTGRRFWTQWFPERRKRTHATVNG